MKVEEKRGRYSFEEDREIRMRYGRMPTARLAQQMRRSSKSVETRARELFCYTAPVDGPWLTHDLIRLKDYLGVATPEQLSVILARRADDVAQMIEQLRQSAKGVAPINGPVERELFKRVYGTRRDEDLAVIFGRTVAMIQETADELRLSKDKAFVKRIGGATKMPRWDDDAVSKLVELYPALPNCEIAQQLGRSTKSVVSKAHNMGLKKDEERLRRMGRENVRKRYTR